MTSRAGRGRVLGTVSEIDKKVPVPRLCTSSLTVARAGDGLFEGSMEFLAIRNWEKFQHYKSRNPPWIKLHYEVLMSPDWVMLADDSKLLAVVCMLLASRHEGKVPLDPVYIQRAAHLSKKPDFKPLIDVGFLSYASGCKHVLADACPGARIETETETEETETEKIPPIPPQGDNGIGCKHALADACPGARIETETETETEKIPPRPPQGDNGIAGKAKLVIQHLRTYAPKTRGGKTLTTPVTARLREGYEVEDLCLVVDRAQQDRWHRDTGKCLDFKYLMREDVVARFLADRAVRPSDSLPPGYSQLARDNYDACAQAIAEGPPDAADPVR